jgi:phosphoenolpyruvate carboxykinase (GTP)
MCQRVAGEIGARETPIGYMPHDGELDMQGLDIPAEDLAELMEVDRNALRREMAEAAEYLAGFGDKVPSRLIDQLQAQRKRLG